MPVREAPPQPAPPSDVPRREDPYPPRRRAAERSFSTPPRGARSSLPGSPERCFSRSCSRSPWSL